MASGILVNSAAAISAPQWYTSPRTSAIRSEEHTSELQSPCNLVCRLLLEKKKKTHTRRTYRDSTFAAPNVLHIYTTSNTQSRHLAPLDSVRSSPRHLASSHFCVRLRAPA